MPQKKDCEKSTGILLTGPDGRLYRIPEEAMEEYAVPEPEVDELRQQMAPPMPMPPPPPPGPPPAVININVPPGSAVAGPEVQGYALPGGGVAAFWGRAPAVPVGGGGQAAFWGRAVKQATPNVAPMGFWQRAPVGDVRGYVLNMGGGTAAFWGRASQQVGGGGTAAFWGRAPRQLGGGGTAAFWGRSPIAGGGRTSPVRVDGTGWGW